MRLWLAALVVASCAEVDDPHQGRVLPADYKSDFVEVRPCQSSIDHDLAYVVVRVRPELAEAYAGGPYPLPPGSLVVKEHYADARCTQTSGWSVMRKEGAGYDSAAGDWQWFRLDRNRRILEEGKVRRCSSCHAACGEHDLLCGI
jgi:hypothetical protein